MNKLLLLALLVTATLAYLAFRQKRLKFEIEFEMEPKETEEPGEPGFPVE